ncbi:MAG: ribosome small subunit-dependent GTPase A [Ignavibacteria bacterium]|nr:ribosome small subunit-dependent GTPase A [Ignavibacteria bacterium]
MNLSDLGFDNHLQEQVDALQRPDCDIVRISRVDRERYLALHAQGEAQAEATGKLLFAAESAQDLPCVGDWALAQLHNDGELAIIHALLPRRTWLRRKAAGERVDYQMIAANIDAAFIVQACDANFNLRRMERYIVMAAEGHIEPVILLSKSDLLSIAEIEERVAAIRDAHIGARVAVFSSVSADGVDALRGMLEKGKTYCLLGSSGVGKTTLLNRLLGEEAFATAPIREKDGRGRHTTSSRQLTVLAGGAMIIDTPGMRELGLLGADEAIELSFADIEGFTADCRFSDCTHTVEDGCGVLGALERGELSEERYSGWMKLRRESAWHDMSYAERRKRDKDFGHMMKTMLDELGMRKPGQY